MTLDLSNIPLMLRKALARNIVSAYRKRWEVLERHLATCLQLAIYVKSPELQEKIKKAQQAVGEVRDGVFDVILALQKKEDPL